MAGVCLPAAPLHPPRSPSPACARCRQLPAQPWGGGCSWGARWGRLVPGVPRELGCSLPRGCWGLERVPMGCLYLQTGIPGLPLPVGRYPWVGDHDGLQVEAPIAQISAERGERAMAHGKQQHPSMCLTVSQAAVRGDAGSLSFRAGIWWQRAQPGLPVSVQPPPARWGRRGGCARGEEGCPRQHGAAGSCSISTAGSRHCCFHF